MIYTRKQLAELLNTSVDNIKKMDKRKTLENNLKKHGYKLINKTKENKKVFYEVEESSESEKTLCNIATYVFNVNDPIKFNKYFIERTNNTNIPVTLYDISCKVNVSTMTIHNWDNKLKEKEIICNDGFFYIKVDNATGESFQVSKEEYNTYWKNRNDAKVLKELKNKFDEGVITFEQAITISQQISSLETLLSGCYYYKVSKFKLYSENKLYIDIRDMIEKGDKILEIE